MMSQLEDVILDVDVQEARHSGRMRSPKKSVLCFRLFGLTFGRRGFRCRSILGSGNIRLLKLDVIIKDSKRLSDFFAQFLIIINPNFVSSEHQNPIFK